MTKALSGGDKLQARLADLAKKLDRSRSLNVGFLEGATYPDGTPVAYVAAIQEFGAPNASIPPRPYFRTMIAKESSGWGDAMAENLKDTDCDADQALRRMGAGIKGQLQGSIIAVDSPALSPVTLMLRKMLSEDQSLAITGAVVGEAAARVAKGETTNGVSTKPLDYTGHMISSVDYEVK